MDEKPGKPDERGEAIRRWATVWAIAGAIVMIFLGVAVSRDLPKPVAWVVLLAGVTTFAGPLFAVGTWLRWTRK